jgi:hypothetical protein
MKHEDNRLKNDEYDSKKYDKSSYVEADCKNEEFPCNLNHYNLTLNFRRAFTKEEYHFQQKSSTALA